MRRRHSKSRRLTVACLLALGASRSVAAQSNPFEGAAEFLFPTGARALGMGQATAASATGSEALWWNPALIARGPREAALHVSKIITIETDASGAIVVPVSRVGAFALSIRYINAGVIEATLDTTQTGSFSPTTLIVGATFATTFSSRFAAGLTYKLLRLGFHCTGSCREASQAPQTIALDLGMQYIARSDSLFTFGAALRNAGPKLQVNDSPQADPLPVRVDVGILVTPHLAQLPKEARVRAAADIVGAISRAFGAGDRIGYRLGAELSWLERYHARAGYVFNGPTLSGATFGLGFSTGKLQIDLARMILESGAEAGSPSYVSLRYLF
jgi:hypothetical protein